MDNTIKLLKEQCGYNPSDELLKEFLSHAEELEFEPYGKVIEIGTINPDAYVINNREFRDAGLSVYQFQLLSAGSSEQRQIRSVLQIYSLQDSARKGAQAP